MKRSISIFIGLILLAGLVWMVAAGRETTVDQTGLEVETAVSLGEPGLAFRYAATFGTTGSPYIADGDHLNSPYGIGIDSNDNIWVGEWAGARAVKYNSNGVYQMSIGQAGVKNADNDRNLLNSVADTAVDSSGNVWIADPDTHRVVEYNSAGEFQSQIGVTWEDGSDNSHFSNPRGIGFDSSGNIYVSDNYNHRIQVFDNSGTYTATIGISGVSGSDNSRLNAPRHFAIDSNDLLYVADMFNHRVQVFDVSNLQAVNYIATLGTTGEEGTDNSHFSYSMGVAVDSSYIYVVDGDNQRVQIFDRATYVYQSTLNVATSGYLADIVIDSFGNIYVVDSNMRVQMYDSSLTYVRTIGTTGVPYATSANHFNGAHSIAVTADGNLVTVEDEGHRLIKLDVNGNQLWVVGDAGLSGDDSSHLHNPKGTAVAPNGDIYVADSWNNRVQIFTANGVYKDTIGGDWGSGNDQLKWPTAVAIATNGNIYIVDTNNYRVQILNSNHNYIGTIGTSTVSGSDNAHFGYPQGIVIDSMGNIYVADDGNNRIQVFNSNHVYVRTLGVSGVCGDSFNHFCGPHDVEIDGQDRLYVADTWNHRIQVFDDTGAYLTTISGRLGDGIGEMRAPKDIAVAPDGTVFVADYDNYRIQVFEPYFDTWKQINTPGFGNPQNTTAMAVEVWGDSLFASASNWAEGASMWWYDTSVPTWTRVSELGFGASYTNTNPAILDLAVFNNHMYASTGWGGIPGQLWRSSNGTSWTSVNTDGFGNSDNEAFAAFGEFGGYLYLGTHNGTNGTEIWRSQTGNAGEWTKVFTGGGGNINNQIVTSFLEFEGYFYAALENEDEGMSIWRTNNGTSWAQVNSAGFGDVDNIHAGGFGEFNGWLYIGTRNDTTGAQFWRSSNGTAWEQVIGDGFGDLNNSKIDSAIVFHEALYITTENIETGLEVWHSEDGINFVQVNQDGFGGYNTSVLWNSGTAVYQDKLYIGVRNDDIGGGVWAMSPVYNVFLPTIIK